MISVQKSSTVTEDMLAAVGEVGGVFATISVAVRVYPEAQRRDVSGDLHDVKFMEQNVADMNRKVRDVRRFYRLRTSTANAANENKKQLECERSTSFLVDVRVEFCSSTVFAEAAHKM